MYLVFDSSSIAKPTNYKASFTDVQAWPRMIHLSWILMGADFKPIEDFDFIVKPESFVVTDEILKYARIDQDDIDRKGTDLDDILDTFNRSLEKATYVFSHNLNFNECIVAAECMRRIKSVELLKKERFCLMHEGTYFCKLPARGGGYKWPTLNELHGTCFQQGYTPSNNARADVIAASRCFIKLMKTGQFEDLFD